MKSSHKHSLAVIPARGGSKAIPLKNIKPLNGKPLIEYTIEEALKSKTLEKIIVSTDHPEIAKIALNCGAEVPFVRPADISEDVPTELVLQHAVKYLEEHESYYPEIIVTLQPTSPLRKSIDIDKSVNTLIEKNADSVVTICEIDERPEWMFRFENDEVKPFIGNEISLVARQELTRLYRLNGAVFASTHQLLMEHGKIVGGKIQAVVMDRDHSVDIDTHLDFALAEWLIEKDRDN